MEKLFLTVYNEEYNEYSSNCFALISPCGIYIKENFFNNHGI